MVETHFKALCVLAQINQQHQLTINPQRERAAVAAVAAFAAVAAVAAVAAC